MKSPIFHSFLLVNTITQEKEIRPKLTNFDACILMRLHDAQ